MTEDDLLTLQAALDGELDAAGMSTFETRLVREPQLASAWARHRALQSAIRDKLGSERAPETLRARIRSLVPRVVQSSPRPWLAMAASLALGAALGGGAMKLASAPPDDFAAALASAYSRARLADHAFDVASSDRHVVKPWLAGKVPGAAAAPDLSTQGFTLVGARVEVVDGEPVATLAYRLREHAIELTQARSMGRVSTPHRSSKLGLSIEEWADADRRFAAVSDLPTADLANFAENFRNLSAADRERSAAP